MTASILLMVLLCAYMACIYRSCVLMDKANPNTKVWLGLSTGLLFVMVVVLEVL